MTRSLMSWGGSEKNRWFQLNVLISMLWSSFGEISSLLLFEWEMTSFSKTMLLQREPFLLNIFYHQQISITRYQVSFYANNYFE